MYWIKIRILPLILFLISILLVIEWFEYMHSFIPLIPAPSHHPDSFMTGVSAVQYDKEGQLHYRFKAEKVSSYSNPSTIKASKLFYTFQDKAKIPWTIQADEGVTHDDMNRIILQSHVLLQRLSTARSRHLTLTTSQLTLYPDQSLAETDKPVTIVQPNSKINSIGLRADLHKGTIQLLSTNQGEYRPS